MYRKSRHVNDRAVVDAVSENPYLQYLHFK